MRQQLSGECRHACYERWRRQASPERGNARPASIAPGIASMMGCRRSPRAWEKCRTDRGRRLCRKRCWSEAFQSALVVSSAGALSSQLRRASGSHMSRSRVPREVRVLRAETVNTGPQPRQHMRHQRNFRCRAGTCRREWNCLIKWPTPLV
jgi:hypothetical protein